MADNGSQISLLSGCLRMSRERRLGMIHTLVNAVGDSMTAYLTSLTHAGRHMYVL